MTPLALGSRGQPLAAGRLLSAVHVTGDDDPNCLYPTRYVTDFVEATLCQQFVIRRTPLVCGTCRFIHAEKLKALVILVSATTYSGKGFPAATSISITRTTIIPAACTARRRTTPRLRRFL